MPTFPIVLFDLDGTITNSAPVIVECLAETMREEYGLTHEPPFYRIFVGPPLPESFATLGVPEHDIARMIAVYRARYREGASSSPLFPGIRETLHKLHDAGVRLYVATSKKESVARSLLAEHGIADLFTCICGASDDETRSKKAEIVWDALEYDRAHFTPERPAEPEDYREPDATTQWREDVVLIGDRIYDIRGAAANRVRTILGEWGEPPADELALAWATVATPEDLVPILLGE